MKSAIIQKLYAVILAASLYSTASAKDNIDSLLQVYPPITDQLVIPADTTINFLRLLCYHCCLTPLFLFVAEE